MEASTLTYSVFSLAIRVLLWVKHLPHTRVFELTFCADLPYIYSTEGKVKEPNLAAEAGQGLMSAVSSYARGDMVSPHSFLERGSH